jgi:hypothetical protein
VVDRLEGRHLLRARWAPRAPEIGSSGIDVGEYADLIRD